MIEETFPQGLKPRIYLAAFAARLKSCPDTKQRLISGCWVPHPFRVLCGMGGIPCSGLRFRSFALVLSASILAVLSGCKGKDDSGSAPAPKVVQVADMNLITVDPGDAAKFPILTAGQIEVWVLYALASNA